MLPDRVSNPGPLTYESGVLPIALQGPAFSETGSTDKFSRPCYKFWQLIESKIKDMTLLCSALCIVALLFNVHGKHLRLCTMQCW